MRRELKVEHAWIDNMGYCYKNLMRRELKAHLLPLGSYARRGLESHEERIESLMSSSLSGCDGIGWGIS